MAMMTDGSRLIADRHEIDGGVIRLYTPDGVRNFPVSAVRSLKPISRITLPGDIVVPAAPPRWRPVFARPPVNPHALIRAAAEKYRLPPVFIRSIMAAESAFNPYAWSPKGAIGLMQLMPDTARLFGLDPTVPAQNVEAGAQYLRMLLDRYGNSRTALHRVIAAYNAGPGAVDRYRGVPPYRETRMYVKRVMEYMRQFQSDPES